MSDELSIACSLTGAGLSERIAEMAELGEAALRDVRCAGARTELVFAGGGNVRERLEAIVSAEARCCPFLSMGLRDGESTITLHIEAPEGAEEVVSDITDAFRGDGRR